MYFDIQHNCDQQELIPMSGHTDNTFKTETVIHKIVTNTT